MRRKLTGWDLSLGVAVLAHLAITVAHGRAHEGAEVFLTLAGNLFVWIVIVAGPIVGFIWLVVTGARAAAWLVALTMAASLAFGVINHFIVDSADHVSRVAGPWRAWFGATAVLLVVSEALGAGIAGWAATRFPRRVSYSSRG